MSIEQIKAIIKGNAENLKMLAATPEYQHLEESEKFTTSNDLVLGDAILALDEIYEAIIHLEYEQECSESK
ncbi:hypothetical protein [Anabaena azotica]|uniref:Uncharacterized protein n=1 Tax=Anabaena azotica FACHB-119 TaxID=947527 RepID=A0ABR8CY25_9NOST|nr:hypothetical protein [Anabaena azotica]MBD2499844.1 hypothetical protein [Anabaena azotica FACHB-119]